MKILYPSESAEQIAFVNWFRLKYKECIIFAVANGGNRNPLEAKRLKDEGVLAGIPDLVILTPNAKTYFIEMKKQKGGRLSPVQKKIIPKIENLGFDVLVCYGFKDAIQKWSEIWST